mmetsp:Transcript_2578/g.10208  ORF Transcript_2578/g.10208 Transcript_2578/m.10208 type:complete len:306 (-) Transcript_2578:12-929(-)
MNAFFDSTCVPLAANPEPPFCSRIAPLTFFPVVRPLLRDDHLVRLLGDRVAARTQNQHLRRVRERLAGHGAHVLGFPRIALRRARPLDVDEILHAQPLRSRRARRLRRRLSRRIAIGAGGFAREPERVHGLRLGRVQLRRLEPLGGVRDGRVVRRGVDVRQHRAIRGPRAGAAHLILAVESLDRLRAPRLRLELGFGLVLGDLRLPRLGLARDLLLLVEQAAQDVLAVVQHPLGRDHGIEGGRQRQRAVIEILHGLLPEALGHRPEPQRLPLVVPQALGPHAARILAVPGHGRGGDTANAMGARV